MNKRKKIYVASIAGHDPSGGAGLLADIKTFEAHQVYGLGILTAITWQNDIQIERIQWLDSEAIIRQLSLLIHRFDVDYFKVGIIKNIQTLKEVLAYIRSARANSKIIWDPILQSSSGFDFLRESIDIQSIIEQLHLITPNIPECKQLFKNKKEILSCSEKVAIYQKGGHLANTPGKDIIYWNRKKYILVNQGENMRPKHGSGCVFSAALCANLAKGYNLHDSCLKSKRYIEQFLHSDIDLLGWHKAIDLNGNN